MRLMKIALIVFIPLTATAQQCREILSGGIYDISREISNTERTKAFVNWYKERNFKSYSDANQYGLSAGIPIGDILIGLGLKADNQSFQIFQNKIEFFESSSSDFKSFLTSEVQKINKDVVEAWSKCINSDGLRFWIERESDPHIFFIYAKFHDDGAGKAPNLVTFTVENSTTKGGQFTFANGKMKKLRFTGARVSQAFEIKDLRIPTTINVNASRGDGLQSTIPGHSPEVRFSVNPETIWIGQTSNLSWHVKGADSYTIDGISKKDLQLGERELSPTHSTIINLFAYFGDEEIQKTVSIEVKTPILSRVIYKWKTTGDDKDWDTYPHISTFDRNNSEVVEWGCCSAARPSGNNHGDNWQVGDAAQSREVPLDFIKFKGVPKSNFEHGHFEATRTAKGSDTWDYEAQVDLVFSDDSHIVKSAKGRNSVSLTW